MATQQNQGVCYDLIKAYPVDNYVPFINSNVGIAEAIYGLAYLVNAVVMIFWIYKQKINAKRGIEGAALYVIFPIYVPFMWLSVLSDLLVGVVTLLTPVNYDGSNSWSLAVIVALVYALQHIVLEGIAGTMMQYGCGYQAARKAAIYAFFWGVFTFIVQLMVHRQGHTLEAYIADTFWNLSLMIFYLSLWLIPAKNMFRRPSVIFYSKFWAFFRFLYFVSDTLILMSNSNFIVMSVGYCIFAFGNMPLFSFCKIYVIYHTLLADSIWWQGLGQTHKVSMSSLESNESNTSNNNSDEKKKDEVSITILSTQQTISTQAETNNNTKNNKKRSYKHNYQQLRNPLLGMEVGFTEAQDLAQRVDNLRSNGSVKLLNFAYISLKKRVPVLGSGSFSKVYAGEYRGIPVAIKMIFTPDLNPEVIQRCCNEAEILSSISHENVVEIYGVSVLPPSVCIVLEKCEFGSLSDILRGAEQGSMGSGTKKYPLHLCNADRMFLALGCARGLEALHNSSLTLCHRDVKSFNFLVDSQLVVKIADLELADDDSEVIEGKRTEFDQRRLHQSSIMMSSWQAPEVIRGDKYLQASDVYSLALVLWEIIATSSNTSSAPPSPRSFNKNHNLSFHHFNNQLGKVGMPYGDIESQKEVRAKIIEGVRPPIPTGFDSKYTELIQRCWQIEPASRPVINEVVHVIYHCWLNCLYKCIYQTNQIIDLTNVRESYQLYINQRRDDLHSISVTNKRKRLLSFSSYPTTNDISLADSNNLICKSRKDQPNSQLLSTLMKMTLEPNWMKLEEGGGAFLVLANEEPYYILWATKAWCKMTGYSLNEILACDVSVIEGKLSDKGLLTEAIFGAALGIPRHIVCKHYRKGDFIFTNSIHVLPIFDSTSKDTTVILSYIDNLRNISMSMTSSSLPSTVSTSSPPISSYFFGNNRIRSSSINRSRSSSNIYSNKSKSDRYLVSSSIIQNQIENESSRPKVAYIVLQFSAIKDS